MVVAPSSLPSGRLVGVQLPRHSQLWRLYPSSPSAVEACGICCILNTAEVLLSLYLNVKCVAGTLLFCLSCWLQDKDFVVWGVCMGSTHTRRDSVSVSVVSIKPKRHNHWCFCHMQHSAWCQHTSWCNWSLTQPKKGGFIQTWLYFSHKRSTCVQQFLVHVYLSHFLFYTLLHIYHTLPYIFNVVAVFPNSCWAQLTGLTFIVHFFTHIAAVTIDPADVSVRTKQSYINPVPLFDRTKQPHVIQDLHCYLCDVNVYVFKAVAFNGIYLLVWVRRNVIWQSWKSCV